MNKLNVPAFPIVRDGFQPVVGLTKREMFAAMAMMGMLASTPGCVGESVAFFAVKEADALIEELEKANNKSLE